MANVFNIKIQYLKKVEVLTVQVPNWVEIKDLEWESANFFSLLSGQSVSI